MSVKIKAMLHVSRKALTKSQLNEKMKRLCTNLSILCSPQHC